MNILIIGGPKNGEWIETIDGAKVWLDIVHATTHPITTITWGLTDAEGRPTEAFRLHLAVHPGITGHPQAQALVTQMLNLLAMAEFARAHGEPLETPSEPSAAQRADGAVVLGPNGRPL